VGNLTIALQMYQKELSTNIDVDGGKCLSPLLNQTYEYYRPDADRNILCNGYNRQ